MWTFHLDMAVQLPNSIVRPKEQHVTVRTCITLGEQLESGIHDNKFGSARKFLLLQLNLSDTANHYSAAFMINT
jgi:hypothetical protein